MIDFIVAFFCFKLEELKDVVFILVLLAEVVSDHCFISDGIWGEF